MNFTKCFFILFLNIFFFNCNKGKDVLISANKDFDTFFLKAKDSSYSQNDRLEFANKALAVLNKKTIDTTITHNYLNLGYVFYDLKNFESSNNCFRIMSIKANKIKDYNSVGKANYNLGDYYYVRSQYDSANYYYYKSGKAFEKSKNEQWQGIVIVSKATLLYCKRDYVDSEAMTIKALNIAESLKDNILIYNCYLTLGDNLLGLNEFEKALEYYYKALDLSSKLKNEPNFSIIKAQPYNYIARVNQKKNNFKKAIQIANQGLQIDNFKKINPILYCYLINNIGYSKFKLNDNSCLSQFQEALQIGQNINNIAIQISNEINLAEYYISKNDNQTAKSYLTIAKIKAHNQKIFEDELKCLDLLSKIDFLKSSIYSQRYFKLSDSLQNDERNSRYKFARIEFETDQVTKESQIIKTENKKLNHQQLLIIAISFFVSLIALAILFFNRQKQKLQKLMFEKQKQQADSEMYQLIIDQQQKIEEGKRIEKKRISMDLHDGVMGRLTGVRMNFYALKNNIDPETIKLCLDQLPELQAIEKEVRNIAHDLNTNLFADNIDFVTIVKSLCNDKNNFSETIFDIKIDDRIDWVTVNNDLKINIYRILQEAVQNIHKYAKANRASITIAKNKIGLSINITDDGVGFDLQQTKNGIGLDNIKQRVAILKGEIAIITSDNKGVKINLLIPI